jgi:hypothetical protein
MARKHKPGAAIEPCTESPALRAIDPEAKNEFKPKESSVGYTSPGHVKHFLPDREVNLGRLNKALIDIYGEPALRATRFELEIDKDYWVQVCSDPWSGNVYSYSF